MGKSLSIIAITVQIYAVNCIDPSKLSFPDITITDYTFETKGRSYRINKLAKFTVSQHTGDDIIKNAAIF